MEITQEYLDSLQPLTKWIDEEVFRIRGEFASNKIEVISFPQAFAIILSEKNKLTADRMKELAELKQELYQLKAQQQIALNNQVMGQTSDNKVIKLLDRNGRIQS